MRQGHHAWDEDAFRAVYERTARPVWAYVARVTNSPTLADDVVQQTYLNILKSDSTAQLEPQHLKNYIYKVATNLIRDHRRIARRFETLENYDLATDSYSSSPSELTRVMGQLKQRDEQLLLLAYVEGFSHREISAIMGYKEASIRPLLARARDRLYTLLNRSDRNPMKRRGRK